MRLLLWMCTMLVFILFSTFGWISTNTPFQWSQTIFPLLCENKRCTFLMALWPVQHKCKWIYTLLNFIFVPFFLTKQLAAAKKWKIMQQRINGKNNNNNETIQLKCTAFHSWNFINVHRWFSQCQRTARLIHSIVFLTPAQNNHLIFSMVYIRRERESSEFNSVCHVIFQLFSTITRCFLSFLPVLRSFVQLLSIKSLWPSLL